MRGLVALVKRHSRLYEFLKFNIYANLQSLRRQRVFNKAYERNLWDGDFSVSGPGSTLASTENLRQHLPELLATLGARSLLDIPCGDARWIMHVDLHGVTYIGADIVRPLVATNRNAYGARGEFLHLDLLSGRLPHTDVLLCRDCLVHLSFRDIRRALRNIRRAAPGYLIATTFPDLSANADTVTPDWRALNLQLPPFGFPAPLRLIRDHADAQAGHHGKYLGVWRTADIPPAALE